MPGAMRPGTIRANSLDSNKYLYLQMSGLEISKFPSFKHLEGKRVFLSIRSYLRLNDNGEQELVPVDIDCPFYDAPSFTVPARIIEDHSRYVYLEVLPHVNESSLSKSKISYPYKMSINKFDIVKKKYRIKEMHI